MPPPPSSACSPSPPSSRLPQCSTPAPPCPCRPPEAAKLPHICSTQAESVSRTCLDKLRSSMSCFCVLCHHNSNHLGNLCNIVHVLNTLCFPNLAGMADLVSDKNLLRKLPGCSQVVHSRNVPAQRFNLPNDPCWLPPVVNKCNNSWQRKSFGGINRAEPCRGALGKHQSRRQLTRH